MDYEICGGHLIPEPVARALDYIAFHSRTYPGPDYETRAREAAERRAAEAEDEVVAALVKVAERQSDIQRAAVFPLELRGGDEADEAERIDHSPSEQLRPHCTGMRRPHNPETVGTTLADEVAGARPQITASCRSDARATV